MNTLLSLAKSISYVINSSSRTGYIRYAALFSACAMMVAALLFTGKIGAQASNSETALSSAVATLDFEIKLVQDGFAPVSTTGDQVNERSICPANPTAGCDFDHHNGIVRTHDSILYTYDYSVNGGDATDIILKVVAPVGSVWKFTPGFCIGDGPPTGDGLTAGTASTIVCHRLAQQSGTAESLPFYADVLGGRSNGAILSPSGKISDGPSGQEIILGGPQVILSAAPRYNVRKTFLSSSGNGTVGYDLTYYATVGVFDDYPTPDALNPWYGSSALATISFKDDVSGISPFATLQGCGVIGYNSTAGMPACSQTGGPGTPIKVDISGAVTNLDQYTVPPPDGIFGVGAYTITVHIPGTDVTTAGRTVTNELIEFDPVSIGGQSNFGTDNEKLEDNTVTTTIFPPGPGGGNGQGNFRKRFVDFASGGEFGFNDFVAPNQTFASQVSLGNDTGADLTNVVLCDVMDISKYKVIETSPGSGVVHVIVNGTPTKVEFATGYVNPSTWLPTGPGGNPAGLITECTDASVPWSTTLPADPSLITKFRVVYEGANVLPAGQNVAVRVRVEARNTDAGNLLIPAGTALANFGTWRSDEIAPGYVSNTFYQDVYPANVSGSTNFGARVTLARATVRISKETENNNQTNSIETGSPNGIGFVLKPVINAMQVPTGPQTVTVVDVLPLGLIPTGESNFPAPQLRRTTCAGLPSIPLPVPPSCANPAQEVVFWIFTNITPGTPMTPITFRATADLSVLTGQPLTNTTIISSPADPSQESSRTATRTIFGAAPSTFLIYKKSSVPIIDVNGTFSYTVSYRNASFQTDFTGMDFIDVLPFVGDNMLRFGGGMHTRNPASAFSGGITLSAIKDAPPGATWYFSNANPALDPININPKHPSNAAPGTGPPWCPGTVTGPGPTCGYGITQVTAVRMQDNTTMPRNNTIRSFTLSFTTNGNVANNVYTNNSGGSVNEILLPVSSVNVPVVVRDAKISGVVWYDTNANGIRDPSETGRVPNSLVTLTGPVNTSMMTNASGAYAFNGLPGGAYTVKFTRPINYRVSPQGADSDGDPVTLIAAVPDLAAPSAGSVDQGFYQLNLRGTVWKDTNCNGLHDTGETALTAPIFDLELLDDQDMPVRKTQTTGGDYVFVNLPAGDYKVRMTTSGIPVSPIFSPNPNDDVDRDNNGIQESVNSLISNTISLAPGTEPDIQHGFGITLNKTLDFGLCIPPTAAAVSVGGRVMTSDGRGLGKVLVTMTDSTGASYQVMTSPFGYYRFDEVTAGRIVIIGVSDKRYTFDNSPRVVTVSGDLTEVDFVSVE